MKSESTHARGAGKAMVIYPVLKHGAPSPEIRQYKLEETISLVRTLGPECELAEIVMLDEIHTDAHIGAGAIERLKEAAETLEVEVAVFNCALTPIRQRNLEKRLGCKVIDRTGLILEIFASRAVTGEGALQVELATLEYQKTRLVRSWTHLERQRGGRGFLAGPGETQIESDRRAIRERIGVVRRKLDKTVQMRRMHRGARKSVPYAVVALCGYTNAGKSTLFNALTGAKALAEDKLFATLDPSLKPVKLPSGRTILLCDTVGFISDLPTELVAAFRATLEEVTEADLTLHVRDAASPFSDEQKDDVLKVLTELNGPERGAPPAPPEAMNKADLLPPELKPEAGVTGPNRPPRVMVSGKTGEGLDALLRMLDAELSKREAQYEVTLPAEVAQGAARAYLYAHGAETHELCDPEGGLVITLSLSPLAFGRAVKALRDMEANASFRQVREAEGADPARLAG